MQVTVHITGTSDELVGVTADELIPAFVGLAEIPDDAQVDVQVMRLDVASSTPLDDTTSGGQLP